MKVVIAGGGSVGHVYRSRPRGSPPRRHPHGAGDRARREAQAHLPGVTVLAADACEYSSLASADVRSADVMIAATGDDEDNLVISWLSKQEFGVPRVISRVNNARNEWLFTESWGVDVSVSTPALITSLVDEAVEVGSIIELMTLAHGKMSLIEVTLDADSPAVVGNLTLDELRLPDSLRVVAVVRNEQPLVPTGSMYFLEHDHVVLMSRSDAKDEATAAFIA